MTLNYKLTICVSALFVVCTVVGFCERSENGETESLHAIHGCAGRIEVAGNILTEAGDPISGVVIRASAGKDNAAGFPVGEDQKQKVVVDGFFHFVRDEVCDLRLIFIKPGFFPEKRDFNVGPQPHQTRDLVMTDLEIVMKKKPVPAPLVSIQGHLQADVAGRVTILQLEPGTRDAINIRDGNQPLKALIPTLALEVSADADGGLAKTRTRLESGMELDVPSLSRLAFSGEHDGFVVFEPSVRTHFFWIGFREMEEAPKSGYQRYLTIADDSPDYVYFYFKADGKFGKGRVTRPYLGSGGEEPLVIAPVVLLMNDKGGRGVATDR